MPRLACSVAALLSVLALTGCMTSEERMAANNAKDDQQCLSYGARKGTDTYVNCRAQLEGARRQADAADNVAAAARSAASSPRTCHDTGGYGGSTIICY